MLTSLIPLLLLVVVMFVMTRSAKRKQAAAADMRNQMQPGTGVRTIGGIYATVQAVSDDAVLLEVAPGVLATFAKNAIATVVDEEEFARVTDGVLSAGLPEGFTTDDIPEDASALDEYEVESDAADDDKPAKIDMTKSDEAEADEAAAEETDSDAAKADLRKGGAQ